MIRKRIIFFGVPQILACDGNCAKAFGINGRPRRQLSADLDDYVFLGDAEVGVAPGPAETVTISEGADVKPSATGLTDGAAMNKWCARECERVTMVNTSVDIPRLPNMAQPEPNIPRRKASAP